MEYVCLAINLACLVFVARAAWISWHRCRAAERRIDELIADGDRMMAELDENKEKLRKQGKVM